MIIPNCVLFADTTSANVIDLMKSFSLSPSKRLCNLATVFLEVSELLDSSAPCRVVATLPIGMIFQRRHLGMTFQEPGGTWCVCTPKQVAELGDRIEMK